MIDRFRKYMPDFSSSKGECINCSKEMSDHDYVSGQFLCLANTSEAMREIVTTIETCEKSWQFDINHGFLTPAEIEVARKEFYG